MKVEDLRKWIKFCEDNYTQTEQDNLEFVLTEAREPRDEYNKWFGFAAVPKDGLGNTRLYGCKGCIRVYHHYNYYIMKCKKVHPAYKVLCRLQSDAHWEIYIDNKWQMFNINTVPANISFSDLQFNYITEDEAHLHIAYA